MCPLSKKSLSEIDRDPCNWFIFGLGLERLVQLGPGNLLKWKHRMNKPSQQNTIQTNVYGSLNYLTLDFHS